MTSHFSGGGASPQAVDQIFYLFPELNHLPRDTQFNIFRELDFKSDYPKISIIWKEDGKRKCIEADLVDIDAWGLPNLENVRFKEIL